MHWCDLDSARADIIADVTDSDVKEMETFILDALGWKVLMATVPDFIQCALEEIHPKMERDSVFEICRIIYLDVINVDLQQCDLGMHVAMRDTANVALAIVSAALAVTVPGSPRSPQNIKNFTDFTNRHSTVEVVESTKCKLLDQLNKSSM